MVIRGWQKIAALLSIAWLVPGVYCGAHFPLVSAKHSYDDCVRANPRGMQTCHAEFVKQWDGSAGYRLPMALAVGFVPIPFIWAAAYVLGRRYEEDSGPPL